MKFKNLKCGIPFTTENHINIFIRIEDIYDAVEALTKNAVCQRGCTYAFFDDTEVEYACGFGLPTPIEVYTKEAELSLGKNDFYDPKKALKILNEEIVKVEANLAYAKQVVEKVEKYLQK